MNSYMLVLIFTGLCMVSSMGISLFILSASMLSSRISRMEGIDEVPLTVQPMPAVARTSHFTDFSGATATTFAEG
jgi:hypothetical protein